MGRRNSRLDDLIEVVCNLKAEGYPLMDIVKKVIKIYHGRLWTSTFRRGE